MTRSLPDFLIIGEMRCGSTTLWEMLSHHPGVFFSEEKELHFFDDRDGKWQRGLDWYGEHFAAAGSDQLRGEATPDYLFHDDACSRIAATVPDARLLVILRDPVERAWSHYWHNYRRGRETLGFEQALEAEEERMASGDVETRAHFSYATRGRYIESLRRYEQAFGRDALCVVLLDEVKRDAEAVSRRVCAHLGIEHLPDMLDRTPPQRNKAEYPRWPAVGRALRGVRKGVSGIAPLEALGSRVATATRPFRTYSGKSRMEPGIRGLLKESYGASDCALADWLGRPVDWAIS